MYCKYFSLKQKTKKNNNKKKKTEKITEKKLNLKVDKSTIQKEGNSPPVSHLRCYGMNKVDIFRSLIPLNSKFDFKCCFFNNKKIVLKTALNQTLLVHKL